MSLEKQMIGRDEIKVWKTVLIGGGSRVDIKDSLLSAGYKINRNDWVEGMIDHEQFVTTKERKEFDLVKLTMSELGYEWGSISVRTDSIESIFWEKICALGLELCPPDAGPEIRIQYKDQPSRNGFCIGMRPIWWTSRRGLKYAYRTRSHGKVFVVGNDEYNGNWIDGLDTYQGASDEIWSARMSHVGNEWVFVKPR